MAYTDVFYYISKVREEKQTTKILLLHLIILKLCSSYCWAVVENKTLLTSITNVHNFHSNMKKKSSKDAKDPEEQANSDLDDEDMGDLDEEELSLGSLDEEDFGEVVGEGGGVFMDEPDDDTNGTIHICCNIA